VLLIGSDDGTYRGSGLDGPDPSVVRVNDAGRVGSIPIPSTAMILRYQRHPRSGSVASLTVPHSTGSLRFGVHANGDTQHMATDTSISSINDPVETDPPPELAALDDADDVVAAPPAETPRSVPTPRRSHLREQSSPGVDVKGGHP
jgi:hypothetical protein